MGSQVIQEPTAEQREHGQLAGTQQDEAADAYAEQHGPSGEELALACTVKCGAPNDAGPKLNFACALDENEPDPWTIMREIANGRLQCTMRVVAPDGETGSLLVDKPFNATGDAGQVAFNQAKRVVSFGISFKNGDEGRHLALDYHNRRVKLALVREGEAGEESVNAHAGPDETDDEETDPLPFDEGQAPDEDEG